MKGWPCGLLCITYDNKEMLLFIVEGSGMQFVKRGSQNRVEAKEVSVIPFYIELYAVPGVFILLFREYLCVLSFV